MSSPRICSGEGIFESAKIEIFLSFSSCLLTPLYCRILCPIPLQNYFGAWAFSEIEALSKQFGSVFASLIP